MTFATAVPKEGHIMDTEDRMSTYLLWEGTYLSMLFLTRDFTIPVRSWPLVKMVFCWNIPFSPISLPPSLSPTNIYQGINVFQE